MITQDIDLTENAKSSSKPLLKNATATIKIEGLIYAAYNKAQRTFQAGIHTGGDWIQLLVEVKADGKPDLLFPSKDLPWNPSHETIRGLAPFWLYVDSGNHLPVTDASAQLHEHDEKSFGHMLNLEALYNRRLILKSGLVSTINIPQGTCYSPETVDLKLLQIDPENPDTRTVANERMTMAIHCAVDIQESSTRDTRRSIVLATENREFFRFPLQSGRHYEIKLSNIPPVSSDPDLEKYFLKYYDMFELKPGEKKYLAGALDTDFLRLPPCVGVSGSVTGGLRF